MNIEQLAKNVASFMTKHSGELSVVAGTLQTVVDALPIDAQDKSRLTDGISSLQTASENISAGAAALAGATMEVVIAKDDVVEAVRQVVNEETGNGNAPAATLEADAHAGE